MITGEIKNKIDQLWNTFWSGGVSNPLSVIEQITYLLFAKRLDDIQTAKEAQAHLLGEDIDDPVFEKDQENLRWSRFKDFEPERKFNLFRDEVFPFYQIPQWPGGQRLYPFHERRGVHYPQPRAAG